MIQKINWNNKEEVKEYMKVWKIEHPSYMKDYNKKYYQKNKDGKIKEYRQKPEVELRNKESWKRWAEQNPEKVKEKDKRYRENHREEIRKYNQRIEVKKRNKKWKEQNPKKVKRTKQIANKKYREKYPEKVKAHNRANYYLKHLKEPFCEFHHPDYNQPLNVVVMPIVKHRQLHMQLKQVGVLS